jgi:hypothetical protein
VRTYQQIVDEIDTVLSSDEDPSDAELASIENDYVKAVQEINGRLRQADELLRKGHRAEALGMCDAEPNLLDAVAVLDFPDRSAWAQFVQEYGLPAPPELRIEIASDLNDAYPQEQQLAPLLKRHRFLALARSDLRSRIDILRKIAQVDRSNPIWTEDLKEFERARHTELQREFKAAAGRNDAATVATIERELVDPRWLIAPPRQFIKQAQIEHARLRAAHARRDLEKLEPELTAAFAGFDVARGRHLRDRWQARAAVARLSADDPLRELVAPALDWLDQEDQRAEADGACAAAIAGLERGLDENADRLELERLYHTVVRLGRGLDPVLESRLAERLRYLEVERARKNRLRLTAIVSVVAVMAALVAFGIFRHLRGTAVAATAAALTAHIEQGQLAEARELLKRLESDDPDLLAAAEVQGLVGQLRAAEQADESRRATRATHLANVRRTALENPLFESIDDAVGSADSAFAALESAESELAKARDLSSAGGQAEVNELEGQLTALRQRLQAGLDARFRAELKEFLAEVDGVDANDQAAIQRLINSVESLVKRAHVSVALVQPLGPISGRLKLMKEAAYQNQRQLDALKEVTRAVEFRDRERFVQELEKFAADFPATRRGQDFKRLVEQEADVWRGAEQWQRLIETWSRKDLGKVTAAEAAGLVQEAMTVLDAHGRFPAAAGLRGLVEHLESVARRIDASGQSLARQLTPALTNVLVSEVYVLRTREGRSYYSREKPRMLGTDWQIKYFVDTTLETIEVERFSPAEIENERDGKEFVWIAPQSRFSRTAQETLARMEADQWEPTFLKLLNEVYEDEHMNPVLKLQLFGICLQTACEGSALLKGVFRKHLQQVQTPIAEADHWPHPGQEGDAGPGQAARIQADGLLGQMTPPKALEKNVETALAALKNPSLGPRSEWIAWLRREAGDAWTCEFPQRLKPSSRETVELFVLVRPAADADVVYEKVGEFRGGGLKLSPPSASAFVEGRPVYALRSR